MALGSTILIFPTDADQLHGVEEIVEGVGAVPELMLAPEAGGDREKKEFVQVRGFGGQEAGVSGREVDPASPKKPFSVQRTSSRVSFRQVAVSCCSSG